MNMFNKLPYFIKLQGKKYKINVDFRNMISFENKIQDKSVNELEKLEYGLRHFYLDFFDVKNYQLLLSNEELYKEACEKMLWFYKCGRENYHKTKSGNEKSSKKEIYSYKYDDEYIWAAFYELYRIDLTVDKLHWWKFKAILNSLPENTKFERIKSYRVYEGKDKDALELKEYWELPISQEEQERLNKIYEALK